MSATSLLRMLQALCAALALVVSPALGLAGTLPYSQDGAPSMRAQRRPEPTFGQDGVFRRPAELPVASAGASTHKEGAGRRAAARSAASTAPGEAGRDWNRLGRLVSTTQAGVTTTYGHDSYFRRATQQRAGSPLELYLYEGPNVAAVAHGAGVASVDRRFLYDDVDHPLWMWDRTTDAGVYFELDCIGNVRRLRGGARYGAGAALPSDLGGYRFTAFGRSIAADAGTPAPVVDGVSFNQPLRWQGRWLDTATGIYDVRNRVWSPELGAFLSPDAFKYFHRQGTLWSWPGQNPLRYRDPWGLVVPTPSPQPGSEYVGFSGWFTFMDVGMFMFSSAFDAAKAGNYGDAALDAASGSAALLLAETNVAFEAWTMAGMPGLGAALGPKSCPVVGSRTQALRMAQQQAQVPRASKGGQPIPFEKLHPSSRGSNASELQRQGATNLGREDPGSGATVFDHPDGHPELVGPDQPVHHSFPHVHGVNSAGEEIIVIYPGPSKL